jgi:hypothetical protein
MVAQVVAVGQMGLVVEPVFQGKVLPVGQGSQTRMLAELELVAVAAAKAALAVIQLAQHLGTVAKPGLPLTLQTG